ncbi:MAG TPA: ATP-binding protein [Dermatophilaceae bacterium]|nr:ATP-binding protein [Dermatophilaceae bacterium]
MSPVRSEQTWEGGATEALRLVVLTVLVLGSVGGAAALLDVRIRAEGSLASLPQVRAGLALVALAMVTVFVGILRRRRGRTGALLVPAILGSGMALAVPAIETIDPHALPWWPTQFLIVTMVFCAWADTDWGWIPTGLLITLNAWLRWVTWHQDAHLVELRQLDMVAGQTGQLVAMGVSAFLSVRFALHASRLADRAAEDASAAQAQAAEEDAAARQRREADRMVHDEILYGLRAVALGPGTVAPPRIVAAAQQALDVVTRVMRSAVEHPPTVIAKAVDDPPTLMAALADASVGEQVRVRMVGDPRVVAPAAVTGALVAAAREAVRNVARHSGQSEALIMISRADAVVSVTVRDRGRGFAASESTFGKGLQQSIVRRLADIGGTADVVSAPGEGTSVTLTWSPLGRAPGTRGALLLEVAPALAGALVFILVPMLASCAWVASWFGLYLPSGRAVIAVTSVAILAALTVMAIGLRRPVPAWQSVALIALAWLGALVNGLALTPETLSVQFMWMGAGSSLLGSVLSVFRRLREAVICWAGAAVICVATTLVAAGSIREWLTLVPAAAAPVLFGAVGVLVRKVLDRVGWDLLGAESDLALAAVAASGARALHQRLADRLGRSASTLEQFFSRILDDPSVLRDPTVQDRARLLEQSVREDLLVAPESALRGIIAELRQAGWTVRIRSVGQLDRSGTAIATQALSTLPPPDGSQSVVTISSSVNDLGRRVALSVQHGSAPGVVARLTASGWTVHQHGATLHCVRQVVGDVDSLDSTVTA